MVHRQILKGLDQDDYSRRVVHTTKTNFKGVKSTVKDQQSNVTHLGGQGTHSYSPGGLPRSSIKISGKSFEWFLSHDLTYRRTTNRDYNYIY